MNILIVACMVLGVSYAQFHHDYDILTFLKYRGYTTMLNHLHTTGLDKTLQGAGPFTVFAPSYSHFYSISKNISGDTTKLTDFLKFHIVDGNYTRPKLMFNELQLPTLQNTYLRINYYYSSGALLAEGQRVQSGYNLTNGVVYKTSGLLSPPLGTVLDTITTSPTLATLHTAVVAAGLENFFQDQSPITLFAPTQSAFNSLGSDNIQALLNNTELLASVLKYHVVPGTLYAAGYHNDYLHTFDQADRLKLGSYLSSSYEIEGSHIEKKEISATNGVVHMINHVLLPTSLLQQINAL